MSRGLGALPPEANSPAITAVAGESKARARAGSSSANTRSRGLAEPMLATLSTSTAPSPTSRAAIFCATAARVVFMPVLYTEATRKANSVGSGQSSASWVLTDEQGVLTIQEQIPACWRPIHWESGVGITHLVVVNEDNVTTGRPNSARQ